MTHPLKGACTGLCIIRQALQLKSKSPTGAISETCRAPLALQLPLVSGRLAYLAHHTVGSPVPTILLRCLFQCVCYLFREDKSNKWSSSHMLPGASTIRDTVSRWRLRYIYRAAHISSPYDDNLKAGVPWAHSGCVHGSPMRRWFRISNIGGQILPIPRDPSRAG